MLLKASAETAEIFRPPVRLVLDPGRPVNHPAGALLQPPVPRYPSSTSPPLRAAHRPRACAQSAASRFAPPRSPSPTPPARLPVPPRRLLKSADFSCLPLKREYRSADQLVSGTKFLIWSRDAETLV